MALAGENEFDPTDTLNEKVLEGIRGSAKPFSWGQPRNTPRVSAADQQAQRESIEARQADAVARAEAAHAENTAAVVDVDAMLNEALTGAVKAKAADVALAPPNVHTATRADWARHEERVRADERAKIEAAAAPAEEERAPDLADDYFDEIAPAATDDDETEDELYAPDDETWDPWALVDGAADDGAAAAE